MVMKNEATATRKVAGADLKAGDVIVTSGTRCETIISLVPYKGTLFTEAEARIAYFGRAVGLTIENSEEVELVCGL